MVSTYVYMYSSRKNGTHRTIDKTHDSPEFLVKGKDRFIWLIHRSIDRYNQAHPKVCLVDVALNQIRRDRRSLGFSYTAGNARHSLPTGRRSGCCSWSAAGCSFSRSQYSRFYACWRCYDDLLLRNVNSSKTRRSFCRTQTPWIRYEVSVECQRMIVRLTASKNLEIKRS